MAVFYDPIICGYRLDENTKDLRGPWDKTWNTAIKKMNIAIEKVIFNPPATIVYWEDGTKTVVKCADGEVFNESAGIALCMMKKVLGDKYKSTFKKALKEASRNYE